MLRLPVASLLCSLLVHFQGFAKYSLLFPKRGWPGFDDPKMACKRKGIQFIKKQ